MEIKLENGLGWFGEGYNPDKIYFYLDYSSVMVICSAENIKKLNFIEKSCRLLAEDIRHKSNDMNLYMIPEISDDELTMLRMRHG